MNTRAQDALVHDVLSDAFAGKTRMEVRQHRQVRAVAVQARIQNRESAGRRRSRFWNLGPAWARRTA